LPLAQAAPHAGFRTSPLPLRAQGKVGVCGQGGGDGAQIRGLSVWVGIDHIQRAGARLQSLRGGAPLGQALQRRGVVGVVLAPAGKGSFVAVLRQPLGQEAGRQSVLRR
jgi:hypothetical protein